MYQTKMRIFKLNSQLRLQTGNLLSTRNAKQNQILGRIHQGTKQYGDESERNFARSAIYQNQILGERKYKVNW